MFWVSELRMICSLALPPLEDLAATDKAYCWRQRNQGFHSLPQQCSTGFLGSLNEFVAFFVSLLEERPGQVFNVKAK